LVHPFTAPPTRSVRSARCDQVSRIEDGRQALPRNTATGRTTAPCADAPSLEICALLSKADRLDQRRIFPTWSSSASSPCWCVARRDSPARARRSADSSRAWKARRRRNGQATMGKAWHSAQASVR